MLADEIHEFKSDHSIETWKRAIDKIAGNATWVEFHPTDPDCVYAFRFQHNGRSDDGGASFGPDIKLAEHSCECCRIALSLDGQGGVVAIAAGAYHGLAIKEALHLPQIVLGQ